MKLRRSIVGSVVAGLYVAAAVMLAAQEHVGQGCMGWCVAIATFPESLLLFLTPEGMGYTAGWQGGGVYLFAFAAVGCNAFVLYVIFGGVRWWARFTQP